MIRLRKEALKVTTHFYAILNSILFKFNRIAPIYIKDLLDYLCSEIKATRQQQSLTSHADKI